MSRKGVTLVELLVVAAIIATLLGLLAPAFMAASEHRKDSKPGEPKPTTLLETVQHDGHSWVIGWSFHGGSHATHFVHHPDCKCHRLRAEEDER